MSDKKYLQMSSKRLLEMRETSEVSYEEKQEITSILLKRGVYCPEYDGDESKIDHRPDLVKKASSLVKFIYKKGLVKHKAALNELFDGKTIQDLSIDDVKYIENLNEEVRSYRESTSAWRRESFIRNVPVELRSNSKSKIQCKQK